MLRVGVDIASVALVRAALDGHGERYLRRVFTERELTQCCRPGPEPRRLAALVAAKEATFKALRVDDHPVGWTDVEVLDAFSSRPRLSLRGGAANLARDAGVDGLALSLTGRKGTSAAAVVIAQTFR
jgi:holo-[acyl-carrier protein] synthase